MNLRRSLRLLRPLVRPTVAGLAALAVMALAILTASPDAHAWSHAHEDHEHDSVPHAPESTGHVCAVTLAQQGFCDTAPAMMAAGAPTPLVERGVILPGAVRWTPPEHWLQPAQGPPHVGVFEIAR